MPRCMVSFVDADGFGHAVQIDAESMYEAAALAIAAFRKAECEPHLHARLDIEITTTITHRTTPQRLEYWMSCEGRGPADKLLKDKLKKVLAGSAVSQS